MKKIGLLGCGSIGTKIALAIDKGEIHDAILTHIYDQNVKHSHQLMSQLKTMPIVVDNAALLATSPIDLVVEAASQQAIKDIGLIIIQNRKDLLILSVGALGDESIFDVLTDACAKFGTRLFIPSGAIVGLDGIKSLKNELESVTLITKKNPQSFLGAPFFENSNINIQDIKTSTILFNGKARQAIHLFPQNINVAALLSLAGVGFDKTNVQIVADPELDKNIHIIKAEGLFGKIYVEIENEISSNPKTSMLAILSAISCLKSICSGNISLGT
ncbi:MAG: aspartate dehydrogenase [Nitrosopumilaceae archaeon]|nr:aspartate dehydrogenase [Nitrosopumilaceae archaeon]